MVRNRYALGLYTAGAAAARTGDEMSGPALMLAGLAATGSAAAGSFLLAGVTITAAAGGPLLGAVLDRSPRPGRVLGRALAGYAAALVVVLLCVGRAPLAVPVAVAAGAGLLGPALSGGWTSQLPRVVPPDGLARANAFDAMTYNAAGLVGPALAGLVAAAAGASGAVAASAALIVLALPAVPRDPGGARAAEPIGAALAAGFRAIARTPALTRATVVTVVSCAGQGMLVACVPPLGLRAFGAADRGTMLLAVLAAAALAANAVLARRPARWRPDAVIAGSTVVLAGALVLAASCHPVALVAAAVLAGLGEGPQLTALFAVRHREAPEGLRGQIFTTGASLKITAFALGAAVAGPLADRALPAALLAAAGVQVVAFVAYHCLTPRSAERGGGVSGSGGRRGGVRGSAPRSRSGR
ncbi:MFS transporter [Actinomadura chibensis]|uniref:MFS transporter n=1 Tax=Actinomadura chibensis TaxID=392828 RepID=A0A5D0NNX1_9ACTN|nr:MFS transporter [Actinomadura chibensis]TYB46216.1 MFS transporter [Actinomadura chibensis]